MYIKKECPRCHHNVDFDKELCPFCGYDFSSTMSEEENAPNTPNLEEEKDSSSHSQSKAANINFCPNCGTKLNANSNFCPNCGYNLSNNTNSFHNQKTDSTQPPKSEKAQNYETDEYTVPGQFTIPPKSGFIAGLLAFFFGIFGFHNLYLRRYGQGVVQLITTIICSQLINGIAPSINGLLLGCIGTIVVGIWAIVDFFKICNGTLLPVNRMLRTKPWQETVLGILQFLLIAGWVLIFIALLSMIL